MDTDPVWFRTGHESTYYISNQLRIWDMILYQINRDISDHWTSTQPNVLIYTIIPTNRLAVCFCSITRQGCVEVHTAQRWGSLAYLFQKNRYREMKYFPHCYDYSEPLWITGFQILLDIQKQISWLKLSDNAKRRKNIAKFTIIPYSIIRFYNYTFNAKIYYNSNQGPEVAQKPKIQRRCHADKTLSACMMTC